MKKLLILMVMLLTVSVFGENKIVKTSYSDGNSMFFPDSVFAILELDGVMVDSQMLNSTDNYQEHNNTILCTLVATGIGIHDVILIFIEAGDTIASITPWINYYQVDVVSVSADTAVADSLERMLDGTGATLRLSQLDIQSTDNKNAVNIIGSGTGEGFYTEGGATGHGFYAKAGAGGGGGIYAQGVGVGSGIQASGGDDGDGINAQGGATSGTGMALYGDGTGHGLYAQGGPTNGDGAEFVRQGSGKDIDLSGDGTINGTIDVVTDVTNAVDLSAAAVDAVWDEDSTGHYTSPNLAFTLAQAIATVSNADMAAIADSVWQAGLEAHDNVAGSFGDSAQEWGATAATGLTVALIIDSMLKMLPADTVQAGIFGQLLYQLNSVINDTIPVDMAKISGDLVAADRFETMLDGTGGNQLSLKRLAIIGANSTDQSFQVTNTTGPAVEFTSTSTDQNAWGFGISSRAAPAIHIGAATGDTAIKLVDDVIFGAGLGIEGYIDTVLKNVTASITGAGLYTAKIYATDTSGTDAYISGIPITFTDAAGNDLGYIPTVSGYATANLNNGTYTISAPLGYGYVWIDNSFTISSANLVDTLWGYDIAIGSPGSPNLCRLYDNIRDMEGNAVEGARVVVTLSSGTNVRDSCSNVSLSGYRVETISNSSGYWYLDLVETHCLESTYGSTEAILYKVVVTFPSGTEMVNKDVTVPDASSYRMTW